jgi:hypothetical protein
MTEALPIIDVGAFLEKRGYSALCARLLSQPNVTILLERR